MVMAVYFGLNSFYNSETRTTVYQQAADQGSRWPFIFKQAALRARNHNLPTSKCLRILWPQADCQSQLRRTFQAGAFSVVVKHHNDDCRYWLFFPWLLQSQIYRQFTIIVKKDEWLINTLGCKSWSVEPSHSCSLLLLGNQGIESGYHVPALLPA